MARRRQAEIAPTAGAGAKRPRRAVRQSGRAHVRPLGRALVRTVHAHALWFALGLAALNLLLTWLAFIPTPHTGGDNAAYIALGRSLLERHAYLSLYDPALPPHTQYPPAFPAILAVAMALGFDAWIQLKVIGLLFAAAAVAFTFLWLRRRGRPLLGLGVALLLALSPSVLDQSHWVLSDVPFWFFTVLALWAFERMPPRLRGRFVIAIVATVLAYFTRSAGLPLLIAALGWFALRRRWKQLGTFAAVLLPLALLWYVRARMQGGVDYVGQFWFVDPYSPELGRIGFAELVGRMGENAANYVRIHLPVLLVGRATTPMFVASIVLLGLALFGWARRVLRPGVAELLLPLYIGLLLVWPSVWSGERFLLPALPLLLFYAGDAIVAGVERLRTGTGLVAGTAVVAVLGFIALPAVTQAAQLGSFCRARYRGGDPFPCLVQEWRDFFDTAVLSGRILPEDAAILSRKPRLLFGLGGPRGRNYPMSPEPDVFFRAAEEAGARYVILDRLGRQAQVYLTPVLLRRPHAFCLMHATQASATALLGILPGAAGMPDASPDQTMSGSFELCGPEFWRSAAVRDAVLGPAQR